MLKRKVDQYLLEWKRREHKPLILQGARQVGKTTSVRIFGESYDQYAEINFLEKKSHKQLFQGDQDTDTILSGLNLALGLDISGKQTLLLLDEIQTCPRAVQALKFLKEVPWLDIIAIRSGDEDEEKISWPVGSSEYHVMNGLDFEEFLWVLNVSESSISVIKNCLNQKKAVPPIFHGKFQDYILQYMVIGGMPETVQIFVDTHDFHKTFANQEALLNATLLDIAKYAPPQIQLKAQKCYTSLPSQLMKQNHKFQYKFVEKGTGARKYENALDWLTLSRLIVPVLNTTEIAYPLDIYENSEDFRIYPSEIGMMMAAFDTELKEALLVERNLEDSSTNLWLAVAKGGLYEALAADILYKSGLDTLHFHANGKRTLEVEFVITSPDGPVPIEIKAGRARSNSLNSLLENPNIPYGFKFSSQNVGTSKNGKKITLPLYMLPFLKDSLQDSASQ